MRLSLVIPCYNEQDALPQAVPQLEALMSDLMARSKIAANSNVWLVDDGSKDSTWSIIEALAVRSELFVGVKLSRNRGHQNALLAGLLSADGDAVVSIDADLQDDLGAIEKMVDAHAAGYEIVYGVRAARDTDTWFKRWTALRYYALLKFLGVEIVPNHADFRLLGRAAISALGEHGEVNLFLRGIIPQLGFRSSSVFYDRRDRIAGESKYPLRKMLKLALDGVTSFSPAPLRMIAGLGGIVCLFSIGMVLWVLAVRLFTERALPGWASTTLPIYALGGVQLLCIGILGEYVAKIYSETKARPRFLIERVERRNVAAEAAGGASAASARVVGIPR
jgi:glycosyltransferase involved in cell wall biosynthesis